MNQTEIDELRRLASVSREPRHGIGCIASDCALASAARNALPRLLAALEDARAERDKADAHIQQVHDWYADRWERLRAFLASGSLMEKGACDIMANGRLMIDAFPASPLALAVARAEGAEAERDALKAKLAYAEKVAVPQAWADTVATSKDRDAAESLAWDALGRPEGTHDTSNVQRLCEAHGALKAKLAEARAERLGYRAEYLELLRRIREGQLVTATEASMRYEGIIAASSEEPL